MSDFKFIVGQEVRIISKDRNLNDKLVKIALRMHTKVIEHKEDVFTTANGYKVVGEGIHGALTFFEDQLRAK